MEQKTYLWLEDREGKSSYIFWKTFMKSLFPEVIVESKKNNSELVKAVKDITDKNRYIIVMDNSFDNPEVYFEHRRLKKYSIGKNVISINFICFEFMLLEFTDLLEWIYAEEDEFKIKRKIAIDARNAIIDNFVGGNLDYKLLEEVLLYEKEVDKYNIEQFSAKLLFELTRNTGFEVSKGKLGECWIQSCCEWKDRQEDDICGLDYSRLSMIQKMKNIYIKTSLKNELFHAGLEFSDD